MTGKINTGGAAYPIAETAAAHPNMGMTLRDYFAGQALIGVKGWHPADRQGRTVEQICYSIADKMIAARGEGHN